MKHLGYLTLRRSSSRVHEVDRYDSASKESVSNIRYLVDRENAIARSTWDKSYVDLLWILWCVFRKKVYVLETIRLRLSLIRRQFSCIMALVSDSKSLK